MGAGDQRGEGGVGAGAVVATDEEPVLAADGLPPERALADVVVDRQPAVGEVALQSVALVSR